MTELCIWLNMVLQKTLTFQGLENKIEYIYFLLILLYLSLGPGLATLANIYCLNGMIHLAEVNLVQ